MIYIWTVYLSIGVMAYIPDPMEELIDPWGVEFKKMEDLRKQNEELQKNIELWTYNDNNSSGQTYQEIIRQLEEDLIWCKKLHMLGKDVDKWNFNGANITVKLAPKSLINKPYAVYATNNGNLIYLNRGDYCMDYANRLFLISDDLEEILMIFYILGFSLAYRYFDRPINPMLFRKNFFFYFTGAEIAITTTSAVVLTNAIKNFANIGSYEWGFNEVYYGMNTLENIGLINGIATKGEIDSLWPFVWENTAYLLYYPPVKSKIDKNIDPNYNVKVPNYNWKDVFIDHRVQGDKIIFVDGSNQPLSGMYLSNMGYQYARASYYELIYLLANKVLGKDVGSLNAPNFRILGNSSKLFEFLNNISYLLWASILVWKEYGLYLNNKLPIKDIMRAFNLLNDFLYTIQTDKLTVNKYNKFVNKYINMVDPYVIYVLNLCADAYNRFSKASADSYEAYFAKQIQLLWNKCNSRLLRNRQLLNEVFNN